MRGTLAAVAGTVVLVVGLVGFALLLAGRDDAEVGAAAGPGRLEPDRGARHLPPGEAAAVPAGTLPTSGPHRPKLVTHDRRRLSDDQILHALELGDVVILYEGPQPDGALLRLQREVAGPFDAELAAAGQAVVLARRGPSAAGVAGDGARSPVTALAWRRSLRARDPTAPELKAFADAWLGRGA
jgi:hypothetical protein